jgi:hypothetical protein
MRQAPDGRENTLFERKSPEKRSFALFVIHFESPERFFCGSFVSGPLYCKTNAYGDAVGEETADFSYFSGYPVFP